MDLRQPPAHGQDPASSGPRLFLSYKTENANVVRQVADALTSLGASVWFAEYEIRLAIYDDEGGILSALRSGIESCECFALFTNNPWARSPWCTNEVNWIKPRGMERVVEVEIPPEPEAHLLHPELAMARATMTWRGRTEEVIELLARTFPRLQLGAAGGDSAPPETTIEPLAHGFTIDIGPLRATPLSPSRIAALGAARWLPGALSLFEGQVGQRRVQLAAVVHPWLTAVGNLSIEEELAADDEIVYREYRRYAREWFDSAHVEERGVHLFFWGGHSHLATTGLVGDTHGSKTWERRYAIVARAADGAEVGEADLVFRVDWGPDQHDEPLLRGRYGRFCDQVAASLRYEPQTEGGSERAYLIVEQLLLMLLLAFAVGTRLPAGRDSIALAALASCAGALAAALAWTVTSATAARVHLMTALQAASSGVWGALGAREVSASLDRLLATAWILARGIGGAALEPPGALALVAGIGLRIHDVEYWALAGFVLGLRGVGRVVARVGPRGVGYRELRSWAPGSPRLPPDARFNRLSPALRPLLAALRTRQRRFLATAAQWALAAIVVLAAGAARADVRRALIPSGALLLVAAGVLAGRMVGRRRGSLADSITGVEWAAAVWLDDEREGRPAQVSRQGLVSALAALTAAPGAARALSVSTLEHLRRVTADAPARSGSTPQPPATTGGTNG